MTDDNQRLHAGGERASAPPRPDAAFRWSHETWGFALRATALESLAQHLFTSAQLRLPAHATLEEREHAWEAVAESLAVPRSRLLRVRQVHGRTVRVAAADDDSASDPAMLPNGDAVVSNRPGALLAVVVADCVPVLLVDPRRGAAAAIHAGWRGTCAGVTTAAVRAMADRWGSREEDLFAAIGPSIGPDDYEVGESLVASFREAGHDAGAVDRWFARRDGKLLLDLWRANHDQLTAAGVNPQRIFVSGLSTSRHPGWLESYRRDREGAGRLVAAIVVPPAGGAR